MRILDSLIAFFLRSATPRSAHSSVSIRTVVEKVGGRFILSSLVQKRLRELMSGAQKLVKSDSRDVLQIIYQEIMEDKIALGATEEPQDEAGVRAALRGGSRV